jgi:hypothetical protein
MWTFNQFLVELFDRQYNDIELDFVEKLNDVTKYWYYFKVDTVRYRTVITYHHEKKFLAVDFTGHMPNQTGSVTIMSLDRRTASFEVFSRVGYILKEVLKTHPTAEIRFTALKFEPTRVKLYNQLAKVMAKHLGRTAKIGGTKATVNYTI